MLRRRPAPDEPPIRRRHVLGVSPEVVEYDGTAVVLADGRNELTVKLGAAGSVKAQKARLEAAFAALDGTVADVVVPRLVGQAAGRCTAAAAGSSCR